MVADNQAEVEHENDSNEAPTKVTQQEQPPAEGRKMAYVQRIKEIMRYLPHRICRDKFEVLKDHVLGSGTYGDTVIVTTSNHMKYAAKIEKVRSQRRAVLYYDQQFLYYLSSKSKLNCVPEFIVYGNESRYAFLIMELLGPCISDIFKHSLPQGLSTKTLVYISTGMLECLASLHRCDVIHRDIKPDNFAFGSLARPKTIYIFDFGLSKQFRAFNKHIPIRSGKILTGTARYVSIATHKGLEQSRRDDLESFAYVLIFFFRKAFLPWMGLKHMTRGQHFKEIARIKIEFPVAQLIEGCPKQLADFVLYCRKLPFEMTPNYSYLFELLFSILPPESNLNDIVFEWETDDVLYGKLAQSFYRISQEFNSKPAAG